MAEWSPSVCSIQSAETRPGADCGSDRELLIAEFSLKLKKVGKTTRSFRYYLNQIPYDYTVELTNRFKGLDRIDRVPEELRTPVCNIVRESVTKTISKRKKFNKAKWLSQEVLQIAKERIYMQDKGEIEKYTPMNAGFQRIARRSKEAFLKWTMRRGRGKE